MVAAASRHRTSSSPCGGAVRHTPMKWADVLECGSDEDFSEGELELMAGLPLAADDSYRGAPVEALEDSRSGLNLRLTRTSVGELTAGAPKDFNFLFDRLEHSTSVPDIQDCCRLDIDAPEFIPTLSHVCPLIGFCEIPEASVSAASAAPHSPQRSRPRVTSSGDSVFECATPTKDNTRSSFNSNVSMPQSSTKKRDAARKRHAAATMGDKVPAVKRTRSEERQRGGSGWSEMPELSQEDWETRCTTRQRTIAVGHATPEYARYSEVRAQAEAVPSGLDTPDASDRSISKRRWKYIVQEWREELKRLYGPASDGADTGSTASADEPLSIITGVTDEADANSTTCGDDGSSV